MNLATTIITAFLGGSPAAARTRKAAAPSVDLSGVGFDALHINPNANAIINGGSYDASNIITNGIGANIYDGAYGLFVDTDAKATVCSAKLIKGGTYANYGNGQGGGGRGGVYVASGATLNIADGLIEGGDTNRTTSLDGDGIFASYIGPKTNKVVITGGKILGGITSDGDRTTSIFVAGPSIINVFGGVIGDEANQVSLWMKVGVYGEFLGETDATVNIYGGAWKGEIIAYAYNNGRGFLNIFGKDIQQKQRVVDSSGVTYSVLIQGVLCDGSFFNTTAYVGVNDNITLTVTNDCAGFVVPTFDECGSGKSSKSSKGV